MARTTPFKLFFHSTLLPVLRKIERARILRPFKLALCFIIIFVAYTQIDFVNILSPLRKEDIEVLAILACIVIGPSAYAAREFIFARNQWENLFSRNIVRETVDRVAPGLKYSPRFFVHQAEFRDSGITNAYFHDYRGRDLFEGRFPGYTMQFSWIEAGCGKWGKIDLNAESAFRGWYFVVAFPQQFQGDTRIYRDVAEKSLGWFGRSLQNMIVPEGLELIHLEDVDSERHFKVLSSDQLDARYVLSPFIMRNIVTLREAIRGPMWLSFRHNCMYAAFPSAVRYFDTSRSLVDPAFTHNLFHAVKGVRELAENVTEYYRMWGAKAQAGSGVPLFISQNGG